jgi:phage antirepressor YoqD-like protein
MNELIKVQGVEIPVVEFEGQRVVTLAMVDKVHQRPEGTAKRNFREHHQRLIEKEDYFQVSSDEIRTNNPNAIPAALRRKDVILLTESGYLMLVKSFTDDLAWEVQRKLVNSYFRVQSKAAGFLLPDFTDPEIAARAWADQYAAKRLAEKRLEAAKPAVEFLGRYVEAKSSKCLSDVAKIIGWKPRAFISRLAEDDVIFKRGGHWIPYQEHIDLGRFSLKTGENNEHAYHQTRVEPKGITWLAQKYGH